MTIIRKAILPAMMLVMLTSVANGQSTGRDNYDPSSVTGTAEEQLAEMAALYDAVCIGTFPDDGQIEALMKSRGAVPMTEADVARYLHQDAGMGWVLVGKAATFRILIEHPPYHACSIRSVTRSGFADLSPYSSLVERELKSWSQHSPIPAQTFVAEGVKTEGSGEGRLRDDGLIESFLYLAGRIADEELAKRLTGVEVRFVHQIITPAKRGST